MINHVSIAKKRNQPPLVLRLVKGGLYLPVRVVKGVYGVVSEVAGNISHAIGKRLWRLTYRVISGHIEDKQVAELMARGIETEEDEDGNMYVVT